MLTSAIAIMLVPKRVSIYAEQVDGAINSPAHFDRYLTGLLGTIRASAGQDLLMLVDPRDPTRVGGLVPRELIERAIFTGTSLANETTGNLQLSALGAAVFLDLAVPPDSPLADRPLNALALGDGVLPIVLRRDGQTTVPGAGTRLQANDHLVVIAEPGRAEEVVNLFRPPSATG